MLTQSSLIFSARLLINPSSPTYFPLICLCWAQRCYHRFQILGGYSGGLAVDHLPVVDSSTNASNEPAPSVIMMWYVPFTKPPAELRVGGA